MDSGIVPISETLLQMYEDDIDVYWLAKGFYNLVQHFGKDIPRLIESTKNLLEKEDQDLYRYVHTYIVWNCITLPMLTLPDFENSFFY